MESLLSDTTRTSGISVLFMSRETGMPTISMACDVQKLIEIVRHVDGVVVFGFVQSIVLSIVDVEMSDLRPPTLAYVVTYKHS